MEHLTNTENQQKKPCWASLGSSEPVPQSAIQHSICSVTTGRPTSDTHRMSFSTSGLSHTQPTAGDSFHQTCSSMLEVFGMSWGKKGGGGSAAPAGPGLSGASDCSSVVTSHGSQFLELPGRFVHVSLRNLTHTTVLLCCGDISAYSSDYLPCDRITFSPLL